MCSVVSLMGSFTREWKFGWVHVGLIDTYR